MSVKFSSMLIRRDYSPDWNELISRLKLQKSFTGARVSWTESNAYFFNDTAMGAWNGCTMINSPWIAAESSFTPEEVYGQDEVCMEMSKEMDVVVLYVDEITDSCGYTWYHAGRRTRIYHWWMGKLKVDEGPLLPAEKDTDGFSRTYEVLGFMLGKSFDELITANPEMRVLA
jgi:hypothetical protein